MPVLESVSTLLQLPSFKTLSFRNQGMAFDVQTGRMAVRDMQVRSPDADFGVGGSIGLDGSLDLGLHVVLSQALSQKYLNTNRGTATLGSLFSDSSGRLVFDFGVGGQYKSPKVKLDLQKTAANGGVARLTSSVVERILGKLPIQVPGLPAPPAEDAAPNAGTKAATGGTTPQSTAEAERKAAEAEARKAAEEANRKLTDKLGGLFKRPAAARDTAAHRDSTPRH